MKTGGYRTFFVVAAVYDMVLGAAFFFLYGPLFSALGIALPNNISYIHLTAAFVFVQGLGYWFVAQGPLANRGIVKVGAAYKFAFASLAAYYFLIGQLIHPVFGLFGFLDFGFLLGFLVFLRDTQPEAA
ncbi:MAG TPA: hypothetical protein VGS17_04600 [Candidatus Limnocylindria bacterium]|nr:hypothetical protein [Candidatus Limnocylindria bacterium]